MASGPLVTNALAWAQWRARGGPRTTFLWSATLGGIAGFAMFLSVWADPRFASSVLGYWETGALISQGIIVILVAGGAMRNAVRKDIETRMIESHRLTPLSSAQVVSGYMLGAALEVSGLVLVVLVLGGVASVGSGTSLAKWLFTNAILFLFAASLAPCIVFLSFVTRAGFGFVVILFVVLSAGGGALVAYLPGFMLLAAPLMSTTMLSMFGGGPVRWGGVYPISLAMQLLLGSFFFIGAARKYRRDDSVAFGVWLGTALVGVWFVISGLGTVHWDDLGSAARFMGGHKLLVSDQIAGSITAGLVLSLVPIAGAAWERSRWERRLRLQDPGLSRKPVPVKLVVLVCTAFGTLMALAMAPAEILGTREVIILASVILMTLGVFACVLRMNYRSSNKTAAVLMLCAAVTWAGPFLMASIHRHAAPTAGAPSPLLAASPIATIFMLLRGETVDLRLGLIVQIAVFLGLVLTFGATQGSRRQQGASVAESPGGGPGRRVASSEGEGGVA